jgi:Domain of Unknown Function (DUF1080)
MNGKAIRLSGTWVVDPKANELVQTDQAGDACILLSDVSSSKFELKFEAKIVEGEQGFAAILHHTNEDSFCRCAIGDTERREDHLGSFYKGNYTELQEKRRKTQVGQWYNVRIRVDAREIWCYLDGEQWMHGVAKDLTEGRVGFRTSDTVVRFRNISVTAPDGKVLWQGLPDLEAGDH